MSFFSMTLWEAEQTILKFTLLHKKLCRVLLMDGFCTLHIRILVCHKKLTSPTVTRIEMNVIW